MFADKYGTHNSDWGNKPCNEKSLLIVKQLHNMQMSLDLLKSLKTCKEGVTCFENGQTIEPLQILIGMKIQTS